MRKMVLPLLWLALAGSVFADVEVTREEANAIKSYDLDKFGHVRANLDGKIVKLKFNSRYGAPRKEADGSIVGQLRLWNFSGPTYKYGYITVAVPSEGAEWFMKLPAEEKRSSIVVFARVADGADGQKPVQLLGREIKTDNKGSRIVW